MPPHGGYFDVPKLKTEIKALEYEMEGKDFWDDQEHAKKISQRASQLREETEKWDEMEEDVSVALDLAEEAEAAGDNSLEDDLKKNYEKLNKKFNKFEFFLLFSGKYDRRDVIMAIHAGTGGTEAQDWAEMLLRMYLRFAEKMDFKVKIISESRGGETGIKSVTLHISGNYAYGYLRSENGVHRLVRISPFDAEKMRHTSFALVEVIPDMGEVEEIKIDPKDLRIDTFLSGGHGGQSVQTTYSAVRITHLPTKIVVTCQNERSQTQNKETAMKILKSRLHVLEEARHEEEKQKLRGDYTSAEWGNQIRSYVLHPYKMVKDHRTKYETSDAEGVLDGELIPFMENYLRWKKSK
ncbi:peptide chain release factor 2 [Patescibacteria group bacterium]|nr:peptide chain release factor 2 [Patescibacteria group bacterium]